MRPADVVRRSPCPCRPVLGFTLIEMLLALVVFASLSLGAYQVLQGVMRNDELTRVRVERFSRLQRAFSTLERDFTQIVPRYSRYNGESSNVLFQAAQYQMQSDDWSVMFVRNGWANPGMRLQRSELQKVGYRLKDDRLERLSYLYVDPIVGTEPKSTVILTGVEGFKLRFYNGSWVNEWSTPETLPQAVEVVLQLKDYGKIRRLFLIAGTGSNG